MDRLKKIIDSSTWVIFFASVIFSLMTVAAQNSIPGDSLYGFKLGYEKVMLASSKFLNKQVDVQIEFVARRFSETTQVLSSKYGSESLNRLNEEVDSTAYTITLIEDPAERKAAAKKYVAQLNVISTGLGQQKQNFVNPTSTTNPQTNTNTNTNANTTTYNPTDSPSSTSITGSVTKITPTKTPTPAPVQEPQIVEEIDDTQQNIEEVIKEMEDIVHDQVAPVPTNTPVPTATPVPPTPTTQPTVVPTEVPTATPTESIIKRAADFCEKHPDKCDNNSDTNNNVIENNQEEND